MLRLIAEDDAANAHNQLGYPRRIAPLNEIKPRPPPNAPKPPARGSGARGTTQGRLLRKLQEQRRLPAGELADATRQVRDLHTHNWLKKHSVQAVPRMDMSKKRRRLLMACFALLDGDKSGSIDPAELYLASMRPLPNFSRVLHCAHPRAVCSGNVLRVDTVSTLGFSAEDVRTAFVRCDRNGDGKLDFDDFLQLFIVAWAHREKRDAFQDSFERDMSEVVAATCRPIDGPMPGEDEEEERVTTSFPFALVANQHRISRLIDESGAPSMQPKGGEKLRQAEAKRLNRSIPVKQKPSDLKQVVPLPPVKKKFGSQIGQKKPKNVVPEARLSEADILAYTDSPKTKLPKIEKLPFTAHARQGATAP